MMTQYTLVMEMKRYEKKKNIIQQRNCFNFIIVASLRSLQRKEMEQLRPGLVQARGNKEYTHNKSM